MRLTGTDAHDEVQPTFRPDGTRIRPDRPHEPGVPRAVRVNGARARGREITASCTPSRRGRYLVRLTFTAGGVRGVETLRVRVT